MLVKNRLKNYYFKFWYLNYKTYLKNTLYKNIWFSTMQKKIIKKGNAFKTQHVWVSLCKFFKKIQVKPLTVILRSFFNLDLLIDFIELKRRNYILTYPDISSFNQSFFLLLKLFKNSLNLTKKKNYINNFIKLFFFNFSKYKQTIRNVSVFNYVWNIKRFLGKNRKQYKIKFKKFKFRYKVKNNAFFKTKNL